MKLKKISEDNHCINNTKFYNVSFPLGTTIPFHMYHNILSSNMSAEFIFVLKIQNYNNFSGMD
jgi:hypothetical protein